MNLYNDYSSSDVDKNQLNICTLPRDVLGRIMTFLVLREITQIDSAIINKNHRVSILNAIENQRVYLGESHAYFESLISYILLRGLFLLDLGDLRDPIYSSEDVPLTPLLWAIANIPDAVFTGDGNMKLLDMLTSGYVNIDSMDNDGVTALMFASEKGHVNSIELLISKGSDVNIKNFYDDRTALIFASEKGHVNAMKLLISKGSDINAKSCSGWTALIYASQNGHVDAIELLISKGSDVHLKDYYEGLTALMWASMNGHVDAIELLISKGSDVNIKNNKGWTALMWASMNDHVFAMKLLISKGSDVNIKNDKGQTALMFASENGHVFPME